MFGRIDNSEALVSLLFWLRSGLSLCGQSTPSSKMYTNEAWRELFELAKRAKVSGHLALVVSSETSDAPDDVKQQAKALMSSTAQHNQLNFANTLQVLRAMEIRGVETLVFKGPIRALNVYGSWSVRRSNDVDLLVRAIDYSTALDALDSAGFELLVDTDGSWWRDCLGEMPLRRRDGRGPVIDLHYRVQQPGGPRPRNLEDFFASSIEVNHKGARYRTLSWENALLVTAINYGKAIRDNDSWLHLAHELAFLDQSLSLESRLHLQSVAAQQGLSRLLAEAMNKSRLLFSDGPKTDDSILTIAQESLGGRPHRPLYRTRRVWHWLDGGLIKRSLGLALSSASVVRSEMTRRSDERITLGKYRP